MCSYLDRGNVGNAYTAGMNKFIDSDGYQWLITMYFIAYICFHWTILVWKVASPPVLVMCAALGWAIQPLASLVPWCVGSFWGHSKHYLRWAYRCFWYVPRLSHIVSY